MIIYVDLLEGKWKFTVITGWWFGTWILFFPIVGMMIQSDELIFFRRCMYTTNQIKNIEKINCLLWNLHEWSLDGNKHSWMAAFGGSLKHKANHECNDIHICECGLYDYIYIIYTLYTEKKTHIHRHIYRTCHWHSMSIQYIILCDKRSMGRCSSTIAAGCFGQLSTGTGDDLVHVSPVEFWGIGGDLL